MTNNEYNSQNLGINIFELFDKKSKRIFKKYAKKTFSIIKKNEKSIIKNCNNKIAKKRILENKELFDFLGKYLKTKKL